MKSSLLCRCAAVVAFALCPLAALAADLTVSAAASLTNAFKDIGRAFEAQNPGTAVVFNFAASDALLAQIAKGAPVDVFAAADQDTMDRAGAQRLLAPASRRNFASNTLVMVAPRDSVRGLTAVAHVRMPEVKRVALGNPASVPAGRYAKAALEAAQLWSAVEPKVVFAQNVRQALDYVARGEVDAGFVYATDAAIMKDRVKTVATVTTESAITYPAAVVSGSANADVARRFVDFLNSPGAQALLARHGFGAP